jgi:putative transcriptional regulator
MSRVLVALASCVVLLGSTPVLQGRALALKPGMLLYAMPGLPDPNFAKTVILLLDHGSEGSMGVVLNRPTRLGVDEALDLKAGTSGIDLDVFWGGPVQPEAVLSLVRSARPGPKARTILSEVQLTPDLADAKQVFDERDGRLRVRIFSGYAGWARGQLAAEIRAKSWVLEPADAATVFSSEPSRMWEKVHDILGRLSARRYPGGQRMWRPASRCRWMCHTDWPASALQLNTVRYPASLCPCSAAIAAARLIISPTNPSSAA